MNKDEIYKRVLDYNLKKNLIRNGKVEVVNFRYAWQDRIITEDEYDFYFSAE